MPYHLKADWLAGPIQTHMYITCKKHLLFNRQMQTIQRNRHGTKMPKLYFICTYLNGCFTYILHVKLSILHTVLLSIIRCYSVQPANFALVWNSLHVHVYTLLSQFVCVSISPQLPERQLFAVT